jgi:hypothetical protein
MKNRWHWQTHRALRIFSVRILAHIFIRPSQREVDINIRSLQCKRNPWVSQEGLRRRVRTYVRTYTAAHISNTDTRLRRIIGLTLWHIYPRAKSSGYPLNRRLNRSNDRCGRSGARKNVNRVSNGVTIPRSTSSYPRDYTCYGITSPPTTHKRKVISAYGLYLAKHSTSNKVFI